MKRAAGAGFLPKFLALRANQDIQEAFYYRSAQSLVAHDLDASSPIGGLDAMQICHYGELDPFSGVTQRLTDLARVVRELKLLCLLYDVVILPPGNLLEHGLTLPAFEKLAPFVRAGRLGTTEDRCAPSPREYIEERARLHQEDRAIHARGGAPSTPRLGVVAACRRREIEEVKSRWGELLPDRWPLTRNVTRQIAGFDELIRSHCKQTADSTASVSLMRLMNQALDAGREEINRTPVIVHLAGMRGNVPPRDIATLMLAVQVAYFTMGAAIHSGMAPDGSLQTCALFPGRFARIFQLNGARLRLPELPPYDWAVHPPLMEQRLRCLGLEFDQLIGLDATALFELVKSVEWHTVRSLILCRNAPSEVDNYVHALFGQVHDFRDALARVHLFLKNALNQGVELGPTAALPPMLPSPWQLAVQTVLGTFIADEASAPFADVIVDLRTLMLRAGDFTSPVSLTKSQAHLLALIINAGDLGLRVHDVKQLTCEIDLLETAASCADRVVWRPQVRESTARDTIRLDRVNVLKTRTNCALASFGFCIRAEEHKGRWWMCDQQDRGRSLRLEGTIWDLLASEPPSDPPAVLSQQQAQLWTTLIAFTPHYVNLRALAEALGEPVDDAGLKRTTTIVSRMAKLLKRHRSSWRIVRPHRGLYSLLPRLVP